MRARTETIVAVATGRGGAIAVVRVSGADAIALVDGIFVGRGRLADAAGYTIHFGEVRDGAETLDQVLVTLFRAPHSYTGEDAVEISCHASPYIENRLVQLLVEAGARTAGAGEFTVRAFLAGKLDLAQAEAVADVIASGSRAGHMLAMNQLRGGVSSALGVLRERLVHLAALLELELDFGEEDVEFASREGLRTLAAEIARELDSLAATFALGNAIRRGVPVAIVGAPNAGKSTLLNALVGEERAMTSEIAGTTRDRIEVRVNIHGVEFRLIDTAGLRATRDVLERMGIDRAREAVTHAWGVLLVIDAAEVTATNSAADAAASATEAIAAQIARLDLRPDQRLCVVLNKADKIAAPLAAKEMADALAAAGAAGTAAGSDNHMAAVVALSAKTGMGLDGLRAWLAASVDTDALEAGGAVVSATRHYDALTRARKAVGRVLSGLGAGAMESAEATGASEVPDNAFETEIRGDSCASGTLDASGVSDKTGAPESVYVSGTSDTSMASGETSTPEGIYVSGMSGVSADLLAEDVRETLHHLGTITGAVTSDDILGTIFSKFCIGK